MDDRERLDKIAAHVLAARELARQPHDRFLRYLVDMTLLEVGQQLAEAPSGGGHLAETIKPQRPKFRIIRRPSFRRSR